MMARDVPYARMDRLGLEFVVRNPGEEAVLPVEGHRKGKGGIRQLSTHPEAPVGLAVRPAAEPFEIPERMSLVVANEAEMPVTITENDYVAVGVEEGTLPTLEECMSLRTHQEKFLDTLDWKGSAADFERVIVSGREQEYRRQGT